jgi:hypothetical protein
LTTTASRVVVELERGTREGLRPHERTDLIVQGRGDVEAPVAVERAVELLVVARLAAADLVKDLQIPDVAGVGEGTNGRGGGGEGSEEGDGGEGLHSNDLGGGGGNGSAVGRD